MYDLVEKRSAFILCNPPTFDTLGNPERFIPLLVYIKNDLVKYFVQHILNGLIIDLINS